MAGGCTSKARAQGQGMRGLRPANRDGGGLISVEIWGVDSLNKL